MYSKARRSADVLVAAAVVLVALAPASGVASIEAAELSGTVTDATGLALTGVVVEARPAGAVAPVQTALTDRTGMFTLSALEPGPCDVTFTLPGFNEVVRAGVEIRPGGATTLDVEMKVGIEEQVVVIGSRAQMRTLVPSFNIATHPINDAATLVRPASLRNLARDQTGFYMMQQVGLNWAPLIALLGNSNDRASRCDEFINPRFTEVPGCTDPNRGSGAGWKTTYDRAEGMFAGLAAGYRFGPRLRVEVEWFYRESEYDQTSPVTSATGDTFAKLGGEIQRAEDRIGSISSQNVFANVYVDFPGRTRLTPYVGVGVGIGLTELDYGDLWARNPDPGAIGTAAGLPNEEEIRRNLAGTTTSKQAELRDKLAGYQLLVGVDHAMSKRVSLGIKARWVGFGRFAAADIEWERLRSHASELRRDGSEPVTFRIRTGDPLSFVSVSLSMRYDF